MHVATGLMGAGLGLILVLGACVPPQGGAYGSQPAQGPGQPAQGDPNLAAAPSGGATCASTCQKTLQCLNAYTEPEQASCTTSCQQGNPAQQRLDHLQSLSCQDLVAFLKSEQQQQQQGASGGQPASGGKACTAQLCQGCVGDGTSCYHGTNLPCDPCCCAPGGPSPVWR